MVLKSSALKPLFPPFQSIRVFLPQHHPHSYFFSTDLLLYSQKYKRMVTLRYCYPSFLNLNPSKY